MTCASAWFIAIVAAGPWAAQSSGTAARLRGLSVVDAKVAWASGTGGTFTRTVDGGATWRASVVPGASSLDFRDVHAVDARVAYLLASGDGPASRIYKTPDGGSTWSLQYTEARPEGFLDALAFWDAGRGLALGDPVDGRFAILATDDGGASWARIPDAGMPPSLPGEGAFAASGTCLVVGDGGLAWFATGGAATARVFRSTDRGRTWAAHGTPVRAGVASAGIFSLAFLDAKVGLAVGGDYKDPSGATRCLARTEDGGLTWTPVAGLSGYRSGACFLPGTSGKVAIAVGPTGSDISRDEGRTWVRLGDQGFDTVSPLGDSSALAAGDGGRLAGFEGGEKGHP